MKLTTDALIIRENNTVGEADRFVTLLTRDRGIVRASVRGARQLKNRNGSATQLLCYSRVSLYKGREKYIVDDAEPLQVFFEVRGQLDKLALAQYFCELAGVLAPAEEQAEEELRLLLNALHYLAEDSRPSALIKAVTELRLLCRAGYMPAEVRRISPSNKTPHPYRQVTAVPPPHTGRAAGRAPSWPHRHNSFVPPAVPIPYPVPMSDNAYSYRVYLT